MILGTRKLPTLFDKRLWSFVTTVNQDYPKGCTATVHWIDVLARQKSAGSPGH